MNLLKRYATAHKWAIILELSVKFGGTITDLLIPIILATMIDDIAPTGDMGLLIRWGLLMFVVALVTMGLNVTANMQSSKIAKDMVQVLRQDLFHKIMELSPAQIDRLTISSLDTRVTSDTYNIQQVIAMMLRIGVRAPIILLGGICISFALDWVLTLVLVAIFPVIILVIWLIAQKGIRLYKDVQRKEDFLVSCVRENVAGIRVIKALSSGDYEKAKFEAVNEELRKSDIKATANTTLSNPLITLSINIATVGVLYIGAHRVANGVCEIGTLLAFTTYFTVMLTALIMVSRIFIMTTKAVASASRIDEVFACEEELVQMSECEEHQQNMAYHMQHGLFSTINEEMETQISENKMKSEDNVHIAFEQVSFSYHGVTKDTHAMHLENIDFSLKKGDILGIIGPTGSGKTTLIMLLMRFYDVTSGSIKISGKDIRTLPLEKVHGMFGIVQQNDFLFRDTILENISFGRNLSIEQVNLAAHVAQAEKFISHLEEGYQHQLTIKGSNLSGGQKQRLLIARAVAGEPDILILDDSSSALDYKTDLSLRQALKESGHKVTTIMIAQRISSIKDADQIIILDEGKILGKGSHEELMDTCPWYKELSQQQMGI